MKGVQSLVGALGASRLMMIGAAGAISLGIIGWMVSGMSNPPMALLFSGLDYRDSAEIIEQLRQDNIKYETQGGGSIIYVEEDEALRLRMKFASDGYGTGSVVGWELFDDQSALGSTSFMQNINHLRALEGELARTIAAIDTVAAARVHLNIPKREIFQKDEQPASASVIIRAKHGQLDAQAVQAISALVASAVPGLSPQHISMVDDRGNLLASGHSGAGAPGGLSTNSIEERTIAFEERMRQQVYEMVAGIVGPGRARVQVAAEVDFNRVVEESEIFDPDGQVVRRTDTFERARQSEDREGEDAVSIGNELPDPALADDEGTDPSSLSNESETKESVSFEISKTVRTEVSEAGGVKRLSVAVVIDGVYAPDGEGNRVYTPRTEEELGQIERLVKRTIGFDEERGDQVEVLNLKFATYDVPEFVVEEKGLFDFSSAQIFQMAQTLVMGLVVLIVAIFVVRPILQTLSRPAVAAPTAGGAPALAGGAVPGQAALPAPDGTAAMADGDAQAMLPPPPSGPQIDIAQVEGRVQASSIKKVGEIVSSHPDESLSIIRGWIHEAE
ncbi:MAG: flagellar basal-body MS-ring/collar protein FliF [Pseudomonadota bacterium]